MSWESYYASPFFKFVDRHWWAALPCVLLAMAIGAVMYPFVYEEGESGG